MAVSKLLEATGTDCNPKKWVFIVGCYNSGTTLLEQILSLHPDIASLHDEGVILTNALKRPEDFGYNRIWYPVKDKLTIDPDNPRAESMARTIKRHWSHFYDKKRNLFVEKSISNAVRVEFLSKYFAPAYFIYIVRNGYAVAEGIRRKANPQKFAQPAVSNYSIEMCASQWRESDIAIRRGLRGKTSMTVSYERLTDKPFETVRALCSFLGITDIPHEQLCLSFAVHEKRSSITNMNGRSIERLKREEIDVITNSASDVLNFYGYTADADLVSN